MKLEDIKIGMAVQLDRYHLDMMGEYFIRVKKYNPTLSLPYYVVKCFPDDNIITVSLKPEQYDEEVEGKNYYFNFFLKELKPWCPTLHAYIGCCLLNNLSKEELRDEVAKWQNPAG